MRESVFLATGKVGEYESLILCMSCIHEKHESCMRRSAQLEWILGKIEFLGLNNRLEQHIPFKSLELVDIKNIQDHFQTRSLTRTVACQSSKFSHRRTYHSRGRRSTIATLAATLLARICCMHHDRHSGPDELHTCHTCLQDMTASTHANYPPTHDKMVA